MIVKYSSVIGSIAAELKDQTKIGKVSEVIIDEEKIEIAALAIEQPFLLFSKNKFVLKMDVVSLLKDGVIINNAESVIDFNESVNLQRLVAAKNFGIGQKVYTDSGSQIGHVYDFLIETQTLSITKFYIKHLMKEYIIPVSKVLSINGRIITIKDNYASSRVERVPVVNVMAS